MNRQDFMEGYKEAIRMRIGFHAQSCRECQGLGVKTYANTATWRHGGIAGQAFTNDVCDRCWGSGEEGQPWPSHREFYNMKHRLEGLEK